MIIEKKQESLRDRQAFRDALMSRMNELDRQIQAMERHLRDAQSDAHAGLRSEIAILRQHRQAFETQIETFDRSQEQSWGALRQDLDEAWETISEHLEKARHYVSKNIKGTG